MKGGDPINEQKSGQAEANTYLSGFWGCSASYVALWVVFRRLSETSYGKMLDGMRAITGRKDNLQFRTGKTPSAHLGRMRDK